jgi:hypothetical protein
VSPLARKLAFVKRARVDQNLCENFVARFSDLGKLRHCRQNGASKEFKPWLT